MPTSKLPFPTSESAMKLTWTSQGFLVAIFSILNASSADLNMSKIDFHDDKMSQEINKINETIRKFSDLTLSVKKKTK